MADELPSAKPDEIGHAPNGVSDAVPASPPAPRFGRRRWLIAVGALLLAATQVPIALRIARRWNRRSHEIIVDRPADVAPDGEGWGVYLDQYECDFVKPRQLVVSYEGRGHLMVALQFEPKGPVDPRRRDRVTFEVFDASGRLLGRDAVEGADERLDKNRSFQLGPVKFTKCNDIVVTAVNFEVGNAREARVRIRFDEEM